MLTTTQTAPSHGFFNAAANIVSWPFKAMLNGLIALGDAGHHSREIRVLSEKTDEELAALGLKRADIAHYVLGTRAYV